MKWNGVIRKLILILLLTLSSCSGRRAAQTTPPRKTLAYIMPSGDVSFWLWTLEGIQAQCDFNGWDLYVYDSANNPVLQMAHTEDALSKDIDGLVISPVDSDSCRNILDAAVGVSVPVVICDIGTVGGEYLSYISTPNFQGAYLAGQFVVDYMTKNGLAIESASEITIPMARLNGQERSQGFRQALTEAGVIMDEPVQILEFTDAEISEDVSVILERAPSVVWSHFAEPAIELARQIEDRDIVAASFDASPEILQLLRDGRLLVCAAQQPKKMGRESVNALALHFAGGSPQKKISIPVLILSREGLDEMLPIIEENICGIEHVEEIE